MQLQLLSVVVTLSKAVRVMYQAVRRGRLHRASEQRRQQHIVEPNFKYPPKNKFKKTREIDRSYLLPATIWQVLNVKCTQSPETEIIEISWNFLGKKIVKSQQVTLFCGEFYRFGAQCAAATGTAAPATSAGAASPAPTTTGRWTATTQRLTTEKASERQVRQ